MIGAQIGHSNSVMSAERSAPPHTGAWPLGHSTTSSRQPHRRDVRCPFDNMVAKGRKPIQGNDDGQGEFYSHCSMALSSSLKLTSREAAAISSWGAMSHRTESSERTTHQRHLVVLESLEPLVDSFGCKTNSMSSQDSKHAKRQPAETEFLRLNRR